jgi:signal peptidase II
MAAALRPMKLWGPLSARGLAIAAAVYLADQASKYWLLQVFGLEHRQPVVIAPFLDFVLLWNTGVSYSLFESDMQWLLIAVSLLVSAVLWSWLARTNRKTAVLGLALIIGGALGNATDRAVYGAVADFVHFFWGDFHWYVFNIADCAIVAGVALLFYDSWRESAEKKRLGNA